MLKSQMKDNEKVIPYIPTFDFNLRKWPYPAYQILKPLVSYVKSIWGCIRGAGCVLRDFLSFSEPKYHFNIKGA